MNLWRTDNNPWGEEVLIGISWDLMWLAIGVAVLFLIGHAVWLRTRPAETHEVPSGPEAAAVPEKIERHSLGARVFHWIMSVAMLALLVTAFAPVIGWQFPWVTLHWIAGVLLIATVVYHIIHAIGWQDFWSMFRIGASEGVAHVRHILSSKAPAPPKAGKYAFDHRMYHHAIVVTTLSAIVTGVLMMVRIDTPFFTRNPYLFNDATWGIMYVVHGLSGVALIVLVAAHIYFAVRPEKRWMLWSMINGFIDREKYLEHFDPRKWDVSGGSTPSAVEGGSGALADASVSARRDD
jgi:cytochrome b subunit of formate dehydrogenase